MVTKIPVSSDIDEIDVDIACEIKSAFNTRHAAWEQRHSRARRERNAVVEALEGITTPWWSNYYVTLMRCGPRKLDDDNLRGAMKSVRDQLAQWLGLDDADERIVWGYAQRVVKPKNGLKSWARVRITPEPHDLAQDESAARLARLRLAPTELEPGKQPRFVQKPRAIPELAGGKPERVIELEPRGNSVSSRLRVRLMKCTRDSGIGKGVLYCHISVFWNDARNMGWRSQGVSIRLEELNDVIAALSEYARAAGVGEGGGGGSILLRAGGGRGSDTPSNYTPPTELAPDPTNVGKGAQPPLLKENPASVTDESRVHPHPKENLDGLRAAASALEDEAYLRVPKPDYQRELRRKRRELGIPEPPDCNATAEDAEKGLDEYTEGT
jgi:hypothetical protein